ncbi:MAG: hypothetical protein HYX78_06695 [Armatimonadetes bacterium]|nr:hypothetical protein [Armatimonadota bacterium]
MSSFLTQPIDFDAHNEEVKRVWDAFNSSNPYRVPVEALGSITNYLLNPDLNVHKWSFKDLFEDPDIQIQASLQYQRWQRFNMPQDREMGIPEEGWSFWIDFQNSMDSGWAGCPLHYFDGQVPDTEPLLRDCKERLYDLPWEIPVTNGLVGRGLEFFEYMHEVCPSMEFEGKPVHPPAKIPGEYTDGPLDLAYKLRGADNLCVDMLTDERYFHDLMDYVARNLINRMKRLREIRWARVPDSPDKGIYREANFVFADDAIVLLSTQQYKEFVYPYRRRILDEFSDGRGMYMHLCGDATRHFKSLKETFNVTTFDTGFPVDHGWLRKELGSEVRINGGPTVMLLKDGTPEQIEAEVRRICQSGIMEGGKFVMIAANNLAPCTPVENIVAFYEAANAYGRY